MTPRNRRVVFHCFDAKAIRRQIEEGTALPFWAEEHSITRGPHSVRGSPRTGAGYCFWHELKRLWATIL